MEVPITQFRREIFDLMSRALKGEDIVVSHKGQRVRIVPEVNATTRFDKVTKLDIIAPGYSDLIEDVDMLPEMQREWEKDWDEQGLGN
jgi:antitoxin (DNA-binding transcriptional repressor) of toxin-antitoxin stability system